MATVFTYDTIEECIAAFFGCGTAEIAHRKWTWENEGRITVWGMRRMIRCRKKCGTWGWCADKGAIHVWLAPHAKPAGVIRLLAHEMGHMKRPFKRDRFAEERKAGAYEEVAVEAFELMEVLRKYYAEENTSKEV